MTFPLGTSFYSAREALEKVGGRDVEIHFVTVDDPNAKEVKAK